MTAMRVVHDMFGRFAVLAPPTCQFPGLIQVRLRQVGIRFAFASGVGPISLHLLDVLQRFCVPGGAKNVVEAFLHAGGVHQRPGRLLLVAENHVFQDGPGYAHELGHLGVHIGASVAKARLAAIIRRRPQDALQGLEGGLDAAGHPAVRQLKGADGADLPAGVRAGLEEHADLPLHLGQPGHLRIMHKAVPVARVGRQDAGGGHFQAFDDRGLAGAVGANDQGHRLLKLDDLHPLMVEASDALNSQLGDRSHGEHGWCSIGRLRSRGLVHMLATLLAH